MQNKYETLTGKDWSSDLNVATGKPCAGSKASESDVVLCVGISDKYVGKTSNTVAPDEYREMNVSMVPHVLSPIERSIQELSAVRKFKATMGRPKQLSIIDLDNIVICTSAAKIRLSNAESFGERQVQAIVDRSGGVK